MANTPEKRTYRPTESQYKGGAEEMVVTYDIEQKTRGGGTALYPKAKRVYIAGEVKDWKVGSFTKRSGREAYGVQIEYEQTRKGHERKGYPATRGSVSYGVLPATIGPSSQRINKVVEIPQGAQNIHFYKSTSKLPAKYQDALQNVR
jgi:hypothetical protein